MNIYNYLKQLPPIEKIPLDWDCMGYTSQSFDNWISDPNFSGWEGDLPTEKEVEVIAALLDIKRGDSLLDLACGYGRHALLLAECYGIKVTGIDISSSLINVARKRAKEKGIAITYAVKHGKALDSQKEFDYAIIAFNSFSLFSPEDAPVVLQKIHRSLKDNGKLFMDLDNKPFNCRYGDSYRDWKVERNRLNLQEVYFHKDISVEACREFSWDFDSDNIEEFTIFKRIYSKEEICDLLSENGFHIDKIYGGWGLSPLDENSPKMILVMGRENL